MTSETLATRRERFRARRRSATIANALRLPFYRELWPSDAGSTRALHELATFAKCDYVERFHLFWTEELLTSADLWVNHTSGTTGPATYRYRTQAEVAYVERFLARLRARPEAATDDGRLVLTARSAGRSHGNSMRARGTTPVVVLPSTALTDPAELASWILRPHVVGGVERWATALVAEQSIIEMATSALHGLGWPEHRVDALSSFGTMVRPRARARITAAWGATLAEGFSASEVIGGAVRCAGCEWFHPAPYVDYDAVHWAGGHRVTAGPGLLVVSELHPLSQGQPFVRYRTGDLVEVGPGDCPRDRFAFRYLGRMPDARRPGPGSIGVASAEGVPVLTDGPTPRPLLRPADLIAAVDTVPGVRRGLPHGLTVDPAEIGPPEVRTILVAGQTPVLRATVAVDRPHDRRRRRQVEAAVRRGQPELDRALAEGVVTLDVAVVATLGGTVRDAGHRAGPASRRRQEGTMTDPQQTPEPEALADQVGETEGVEAQEVMDVEAQEVMGVAPEEAMDVE